MTLPELAAHAVAPLLAAPAGSAARSAEEEAVRGKLLRGEKLTREKLTLWLGEPPETFWPRFFASIRPWDEGIL